MTKGTFWMQKRDDGSVSIGVEDYNVEFFDGMDYEMIYTFDPENLRLLTNELKKTSTGTLEEMIEDVFGAHLDKQILSIWLMSRGINYDLFTWTS